MKRSSWTDKKAPNAGSLRFFTVFFLCLGFLAGCVVEKAVRENRYRIPWPDSSGRYHLQDVPIESYDRPERLSGRFVEIFVDPTVVRGRLDGLAPIGRYLRNPEGVWIAEDFVSLQAAAIQAHHERLAKIDEELGVDSDRNETARVFGAAQKEIRRARVGLQVNLPDQSPISRGKGRGEALYADDLDAVLISPYSKSALPLALNAGVLAHEHFHAIFQDKVLKGFGAEVRLAGQLGVASEHFGSNQDRSHTDGKSKPIRLPITGAPIAVERSFALYNAFYLRAINEGLADFWGWMYSGDPNFIGASLPESAELRRLDAKSTARIEPRSLLLLQVQDPFGRVLSSNEVLGHAYALGTLHARVLHNLVVVLRESGIEGRAAQRSVAQAVVRSLPGLAKSITPIIQSHGMIHPNAFFRVFKFELEKIMQENRSSVDVQVQVCGRMGEVVSTDEDREEDQKIFSCDRKQSSPVERSYK